MGKRRVWSSPVYYGNTAAQQKIMLDDVFIGLHDAMIALGMTQTTDTGQADDLTSYSTVMPASIINAGYRIYALNDAMHTNSPIFIKIGYGATGTTRARDSAFVPRITVQAGSATNGTGDLINATSTLVNIGFTDANLTDASHYFSGGDKSSFVYKGEGIFWFSLKADGIKTHTSSGIKPTFTDARLPIATFIVSRPCDNAGTLQKNKIALISLTSKGANQTVGLLISDSNPVASFINTENGYLGSSEYVLAKPLSDSLMSLGGSAPLSRVYGYFGDGKVYQLSGIASVTAVQVSSGDTISIALEGIVEREYLISNRNTKGFETISSNDYFRNKSDSHYWDTPALAWDGENV